MEFQTKYAWVRISCLTHESKLREFIKRWDLGTISNLNVNATGSHFEDRLNLWTAFLLKSHMLKEFMEDVGSPALEQRMREFLTELVLSSGNPALGTSIEEYLEESIPTYSEKKFKTMLQDIDIYLDLLERFPEFREMEFYTRGGYFTLQRAIEAAGYRYDENGEKGNFYVRGSKTLLERRAAKPQLDLIIQNPGKEGYSLLCRTPNTRELDEMFGLYGGDGYGTMVDNTLHDATTESVEMLRGALVMTPMQCGSLNVLSYFFDVVQRLSCFVALPYDEINALTKGNVTTSQLEEASGEHFIRKYHHQYADKDVVEVTTKFRPLKDMN